jgi:hypothetical protein
MKNGQSGSRNVLAAHRTATRYKLTIDLSSTGRAAELLDKVEIAYLDTGENRAAVDQLRNRGVTVETW